MKTPVENLEKKVQISRKFGNFKIPITMFNVGTQSIILVKINLGKTCWITKSTNRQAFTIPHIYISLMVEGQILFTLNFDNLAHAKRSFN